MSDYYTDDHDVQFCPLCGAHPMEHGEGTASQGVIDWWLKDEENRTTIETLYNRMQEVKPV